MKWCDIMPCHVKLCITLFYCATAQYTTTNGEWNKQTEKNTRQARNVKLVFYTMYNDVTGEHSKSHYFYTHFSIAHEYKNNKSMYWRWRWHSRGWVGCWKIYAWQLIVPLYTTIATDTTRLIWHEGVRHSGFYVDIVIIAADRFDWREILYEWVSVWVYLKYWVKDTFLPLK